MSIQNTVHKLNYRPDIDGLRTIAVLSVIIFHINKELIPGGFVGVDIFFVISGFLISRFIMRDLQTGHFSLLEFYRRRIKRIIPPMLLVLFFTLLAAQFLLLPDDAKQVAKSGIWSLLSMANVYFTLYQDTGYFADASSQIPLLHLWSLGVEEQFYLIWPLVLMATFRPARIELFGIVVVIISLASFVFAELYFKTNPLFVYYMLPSRAGELLAGALVAMVFFKNPTYKIPNYLVTTIAICGLGLVAFSLSWLSESKVFPGLLALLPTTGAALIILAGGLGEAWILRILANRLMIWIGLLSYSAYLWHWPLLVFYRYGYREITFYSGTAIFLLTFLLAWLSFRFVERPSRQSKGTAVAVIIKQFMIPAGVLAFLALAIYKLDGYGLRWFSSEYKARLDAVMHAEPAAETYSYVCERNEVTIADTKNDNCVLGQKSNTPPKVLLWGDSNSSHYVGVLGKIAEQAGFSFRHIASGACPPLLEGDLKLYVTAKKYPHCLASNNIARELIKEYPVIVIAGSWVAYQNDSPSFIQDLKTTIEYLVAQNRKVIVMGKNPVFIKTDPLCPAKALVYPWLSCEVNKVPLSQDVANFNAMLKEFAEKTPNVKYFDVIPYLCQHGLCSPTDPQGNKLYFDAGHFSISGSWKLGNLITQQSAVPAPFDEVVGWIANANKDLK